MSKSKTKNCTGKDNFERINYLYQISNNTFSQQGENTASALYSNLLLSIAKKSVQRVEPEIKRTLCKKCHTLIIAGVSAKVRIRNKRVRWTCNRCQTSKVFQATPNYLLWIQNRQAVVETLKY